MQCCGFEAYQKSIAKVEAATVFMAKNGDETALIIEGDAQKLGFNGKSLEDGKFCAPLNHENAKVLRKLFPYTAPVKGLTKPKSFGLGDRLGVATPGHIKLFEQYDIFPIFAQQSIRELNLTHRTYEDVLDAVTFAVFREGFKSGFGADGDHLKTAKDVEYALSIGFSMITLDCSEHIKNDVTAENAPPLPAKYGEKYLGKKFDIGEGIVLAFDEVELRKCVAIYEGAIKHATEIYEKFFKSGKYHADFEVSVDETLSTTSPLQHFFVARELLDAGVVFATVAPRFCGEFQKGIDYIGDIKQFEKEIHIHAAIARHLGYKLSIHSGSDKFSVFPFIGKETHGVFHVKTAGTNWLEAMRVVAEKDAHLYREVHKYALESFTEASKYYHVTADLTKIPCVDSLKDAELPSLFENNDARQLIHITYGLILGKKNPDGAFSFKDRLFKLWRDHEGAYNDALVRHIGKHIERLGINKK